MTDAVSIGDSPIHGTGVFATLSRNGFKVYWGANWYDTSRPIDLYMVDLPPTWFSDLGGPPPPVPDPPTGLAVN